MYDGHSDPKQFLMSYEATISSYGGNAAVMAKSRHGSPECGPDLVFFPSATNNYVVAEAQGHASDQFPRLSDEASHSSGPVPMHARPRRIPSDICTKVLAIEGTSAYGAQ
jgi:hypothetical protein